MYFDLIQYVVGIVHVMLYAHGDFTGPVPLTRRAGPRGRDILSVNKQKQRGGELGLMKRQSTSVAMLRCCQEAHLVVVIQRIAQFSRFSDQHV